MINHTKKKFDVEKESLKKMSNSPTTNGRKIKGKMLKSYFTTNGTLYQNDIVVLDGITDPKVRVSDQVGRIFWIKTADVQVIK